MYHILSLFSFRCLPINYFNIFRIFYIRLLRIHFINKLIIVNTLCIPGFYSDGVKYLLAHSILGLFFPLKSSSKRLYFVSTTKYTLSIPFFQTIRLVRITRTQRGAIKPLHMYRFSKHLNL